MEEKQACSSLNVRADAQLPFLLPVQPMFGTFFPNIVTSALLKILLFEASLPDLI